MNTKSATAKKLRVVSHPLTMKKVSLLNLAANDNCESTVESTILAEVDAGFIAEHKRVFSRCRHLTMKVRSHVADLVTEERGLHFTGCRVRVVHFEVEEPIFETKKIVLRNWF
jgi:hypothetical protein